MGLKNNLNNINACYEKMGALIRKINEILNAPQLNYVEAIVSTEQAIQLCSILKHKCDLLLQKALFGQLED
jgi:hypothetical protein